MRVVSASEFATWTHSTRSAGAALDAAAYVKLSKQSLNVAPGLYRSVHDGLFNDIVTQAKPPGAGPPDPMAWH